MKKIKYTSEIFLTSKYVSLESWQKFIYTVSKHIGIFRTWKIIAKIELNEIRYFVESSYQLPPTIGDSTEFLLKETDNFDNIKYSSAFFCFRKIGNNLVDIFDKNEIKYSRKLRNAEIIIYPLKDEKYISKTYIYFETTNKKVIKKRLILNNAAKFLSIDFSNCSRFFYKKSPKYLNIQKTLHLLKSDKNNAILKVDTFPYLQGSYYLNQNEYNFDKHSLVVGSSGSGKSKFLSLLINNISSNLSYKLKYKIVVIDPHSSLEKDIGGLENSKVIDFKTLDNSIDLFANSIENIISSSELLISIFKTLMASQYNSKLERLLRHSIHLLLSCEKFTFQNLRKLLLNVEYRNLLVKEMKSYIPESVVDFFLTDFNELKTRSYNETIAPIISFIDEMELIPVFTNKKKLDSTLVDTIQSNFLTVFSLDRISLGEKVIKTISGLIMQQVMQIIQSHEIDEHIILIVDEVSVIENPILINFLSEARKYGLSIILSQQYFDQISEPLKNAVFANIINYYVFRVSKNDANVLVDNMSMKLSKDDTKEEKIKMLINLNDRECIARISSGGLILPAFKAKTIDFIPIPRRNPIEIEKPTIKIKTENQIKKKFEINNTVSLKEILLNQSSSRRNLRGENND